MMRDTTTRVLLVIAGISNLAIGLWAALAPESFYDNFPGSGRHWVALDGPYNEHLVRDVGDLNLALAAVFVAALVLGTRHLVMVAGAAELIYAAPHLLYHATHLDPYRSSDKAALVISLSVAVLVPIALVVRSSRRAQGSINSLAA